MGQSIHKVRGSQDRYYSVKGYIYMSSSFANKGNFYWSSMRWGMEDLAHRKSIFEGKSVELPFPMTFPISPPRELRPLTLQTTPLLLLHFGNTFQKRRVSSPAPVTMEAPSGLMARYRTRKVCPVSVLIFSIVGYFHTMIWFREYPWVLTISSVVLENIRLHTWEPVFTLLMFWRVKVFQNRMHWSAVPPPVAKRPLYCGLHPIALTAAWCWLNLTSGWSPFCMGCHMNSLLSFPPEAI